MKNMKIKRILAIIAVVAMLAVTLVGCAKKSAQGTAPAPAETQAQAPISTETQATTQTETQAQAKASTETQAQSSDGVKASTFVPSEIHDLTCAEAIGDFGSVKVMDMYKLRDIVSMLKDAKKLGGWPNCPYDMTIRLTRKDGKVFEFQPATDDCGNLLSGGNDWYSFSKYGNKRLFDVFNLTPLAGKVIVRETLPPYKYNGDSGILKAAIEYFIKAGKYSMPKGSAVIPEFVIVKIEEDADGNAKVYGNFWMSAYTKKGRSLVNESGGSSPGVLYLKKTGDNTYTVEKYDEAGDGDDMDKDIKRFCNGDKKLEEKYYAAGNVSTDLHKEWKNWFLYNYVKDNKLDIGFTEDFGQAPVEIKPVEKMPDIN